MKRGRVLQMLVLITALSCCAVPGWADSYQCLATWDGFETHQCSGDPFGDPISAFCPPIGNWPDCPDSGSCNASKWNDYGDGDYHTVDCTHGGAGGSQNCLRTVFAQGGTPSMRSEAPLVWTEPGNLVICEHDVFIPDGQYASAAFYDFPTCPAGYDANSRGNWRYITDDDPCAVYAMRFIDSGIPVIPNIWNHVKVVLDGRVKKYSMYVTPTGGAETLIVANVPWPNKMTYGGYAMRQWMYPCQIYGHSWSRNEWGYLNAQPGNIVYWDNVSTSIVHPNAQGFPVIGTTAPAGIVIDGHIGTSEWAGVKRIAHKPLGSNGNDGEFLSVSHHSSQPELDVNQTVDVYTAYDNNNFYIAARFNKAQIKTASTDPAYFDTVIAFSNTDPTQWWLDRSYVFECSALANNPPTGLTATRYKTSGNHLTIFPQKDTLFTYDSNVVSKGGGMSYSVSGDVMEVEMKIPFASVPEIGLPSPGKKVLLWFNVSGWTWGAIGTAYRGPSYTSGLTTNILMEKFIGEYYWGRVADAVRDPSLYVPGAQRATWGAGITFPKLGDFNGDGFVNFVDFAWLAQGWLLQTISAVNMNADGIVNTKDLRSYADQWLK